MVQNDVPVSARRRKRFTELLHHPIASRMGSHIEMQDSSAPVLDDKQTVQKLKSDRRNGKEIARDDYFTMVVEKRQPALAGIPTATNCTTVTCDRPFRDLKAEHEKFTVDFRCSPGRIVPRETTDQISNLLADPGSAPLSAGTPSPISTEASAVPLDHGVWFDDDQHVFPLRTESAEQNPEDPVMHSQPGFWMFSFEDGDLLSKSQDLQSEILAGPEKDSAGGKQSEDERDHETTVVTPFNV